MATKWYNKQTFTANVNSREYKFIAHTTGTRNGFCHTVETYCKYRKIVTDTKSSYINRAWESFTYETALRRAIAKCPKEDQQGLIDIIIEKKAQAEHEKAEAFVGAFEKVWSGVNDEYKDRIRSAFGTIETNEQAEAVMAAAKLATVFQTIAQL